MISGCHNGQVRVLFWIVSLLLYPYRVEEASELHVISFIKALIPVMRAPLHYLIISNRHTY